MAYWEKHSIPFIGVADPDHRVANLYGQPVRLLKLGRLPSQFIIDIKSVVRFRHDGESMSDIPSCAAIFAEFDKLDSIDKP